MCFFFVLGQAFVFLFEALEVFRRFVWNFFRVEWQFVQERRKDVSTVQRPRDSTAKA